MFLIGITMTVKNVTKKRVRNICHLHLLACYTDPAPVAPIAPYEEVNYAKKEGGRV